MKKYSLALGITALVYILVNLFALAYDYFFIEKGDSWSYAFDNGAFYIEDQPIGLPLNDGNTIFFLLIVFILMIILLSRRERAKID